MNELDRSKINAEIANIIAQSSKLSAETAKINAEARFYPYIVAATVLAGIAALAKLFG